MFHSYDELLEISQYATIDELVAQGLSPLLPDDNGIFILNPACRALNLDLTKSLIDAGANVNSLSSDGYTPLLSAIDCAHKSPKTAMKLVALLLDSGAELEGRGDWDKTPFLKSCTRGVAELTQLLVDRGCDIYAIAKEIGGPMTAKDFANLSSNSPEFRKYVYALFPNEKVSDLFN